MGRPDRDYYKITPKEQCLRNLYCCKSSKHRGACNVRPREQGETGEQGEIGEDSLYQQFMHLKSIVADGDRLAARRELPVSVEVLAELQLAYDCIQAAAEEYKRMRGQGSKVAALSTKFEAEKAITKKVHSGLVAQVELPVQKKYIRTMIRCDDPPAPARLRTSL